MWPKDIADEHDVASSETLQEQNTQLTEENHRLKGKIRELEEYIKETVERQEIHDEIVDKLRQFVFEQNQDKQNDDAEQQNYAVVTKEHDAIIAMTRDRENSLLEQIREIQEKLANGLNDAIHLADEEGRCDRKKIHESLKTLQHLNTDIYDKLVTGDRLLDAVIKLRNATTDDSEKWPEDIISLYKNIKDKIGADWSTFADHLGLDPTFISSLHYQTTGKQNVDFQMLFCHVMAEWRKKPHFSIHSLANACRAMGVKDPTTVTPMSAINQKILKQEDDYLCKNIMSGHVVRALQEKNVLSPVASAFISDAVSENGKTARLLDIIMYCGDQGYFNLKQALGECGYDFVVKYLEECNKNEETYTKEVCTENEETYAKEADKVLTRRPEVSERESDLEIPERLEIGGDKDKLRFISESQACKDEMASQLVSCHAEIKWPKETDGPLIVFCTMDATTPNYRQLQNSWKIYVGSYFKMYLRKILREEVPVSASIVLEMLQPLSELRFDSKARVYFRKTSIVIVGEKTKARALTEKLKQLRRVATENVNVGNSSFKWCDITQLKT